MTNDYCKGVCDFEVGTNVCVGCGRTAEEVHEWFEATIERKKEIVKKIKERKNDSF